MNVDLTVQEYSSMAAEGGSAELPAGGLRPHGGGGRARLQPAAVRRPAGQRVQGHHHQDLEPGLHGRNHGIY